MALNTLALIFVSEQLEYLAHHWFGLLQLDRAQGEDEAFEWGLIVRTSAYAFTVNQAGFACFCEERAIKWNDLVAANYHGHALRLAVERMTAVAPDRDELIALLRVRGGEMPEPTTVENQLENWRRIAAQMVSE